MGRMRANVWVIACALGLAACGDDGSPAHDGGRGDGGSADSGSPSDTRRFVPDIPSTYGGALAEPEIEVLAFTLREDDVFGEQYLVALRNTSAARTLCAIEMTTQFFDAGGANVALAQGAVATPPARGASGTGALTNCLLPGQLGMQAAPLELTDGSRVSDIAASAWEISASERTDAIASTELEVAGVMAVPTGFGGYEFTGRLENHAATAVRDPALSIFGVNAVGRPLFAASDIEVATIAASSAWTFATTPSFDEPYADFVAFPEAHDD